ncbi:MAG TPA: PaaI family thioesterase [Vicinamibacterales bacterium]|nr:PaaI family thioesterase [Vicinamibacterales bacterium]
MTLVDARRSLSGIEYFTRMLAGEYQPPAMLQLLGIRLLEAEVGRVVFATTVDERFYNGTGVAHGGFAATLLDTALGCAINTTTPPGKRFTTLELKVNLTRPLTTAAGEVRCEGVAVHVGKQTATAEARIVDRNGRLYAHGSTTCIAIEMGEGTPNG